MLANLLALGYGMTVGWSSPMLPLLISQETPMHFGPITTDDAGNAGAIYCGGAAFATVLFGFMVDYCGRKFSAYFCAILLLACWLCKIFATAVWHILAGRLVAGFFGGGVWLVIPIIVTEITDDCIRGAMGSYLTLLSCGGIGLGYLIGGYLDYYTFAYISVAIPILFMILFYRFPETPSYLLAQMKNDEARKSAEFYFGESIDEKIPIAEYLGVENVNDKEGFRLSDLKSRETRKGAVIFLVLVLMTQFSGAFLINNYMKTIFVEAGIDVSTDLASIIVSVLQVSAVFISSLLVDRAGRRKLLILSSLLTAACLITLSLFLYMKQWGYDVSVLNWIPIVSVAGTIFNASWGLLPVTFVIGGELLSQKVRGFATAAGLSIAWLMGLILLKYFYFILEIINLQGSMLIFGCCCLAEMVFTMFCIPETKGKSIDEISKLL